VLVLLTPIPIAWDQRPPHHPALVSQSVRRDRLPADFNQPLLWVVFCQSAFGRAQLDTGRSAQGRGWPFAAGLLRGGRSMIADIDYHAV
jgi:hypothetical protein